MRNAIANTIPPPTPLSQFLHPLSHTLTHAQSFASQVYMTDIQFGANVSPSLGELYDKYANVKLFPADVAAAWPGDIFGGMTGDSELGANAVGSTAATQEGGVLTTLDGKIRHSLLPTTTSKPRNEKEETKNAAPILILIPPGGVARFDVHVHTPPSSIYPRYDDAIHEGNQPSSFPFLASGLSLSTPTSHIPILVSYDVILGHLQFDTSEDDGQNRLFSSVPGRQVMMQVRNGQEQDASGQELNRLPQIAWNNSYTMRGSPTSESSSQTTTDGIARDGSGSGSGSGSVESVEMPFVFSGPTGRGGYAYTPLFLRSTFGREVQLLTIDSCNPMFGVDWGSNSQNNNSNNNTNNTNANNTNNNNNNYNFTTVLAAREKNIPIGKVMFNCGIPNDAASGIDTSFWSCATQFVTERHTLQPADCGNIIGITGGGGAGNSSVSTAATTASSTAANIAAVSATAAAGEDERSERAFYEDEIKPSPTKKKRQWLKNCYIHGEAFRGVTGWGVRRVGAPPRGRGRGRHRLPRITN